MTIHTITLQEQIAEVEHLLIAERRKGTRSDALRAIAADLRGRIDGAPSATATFLQRRINSVQQSKTSTGYHQGALIALGQEFIGHWPTIKQALERFEDEVSK